MQPRPSSTRERSRRRSAARSSAARTAALLASVALTAAAGPARAQTANAADGRARESIRAALEAFQGLDLDRAAAQLREAGRRCGQRRNACSNAVQADIQIATGIVAIGGRNDRDAGLEAFTQALRLNPTAQLDPMVATPEMNTVFARARRAARPGPPVTDLLHTPITEQLTRTPVPIYIETGINGAVRVDLYYRARGASSFTTVRMSRHARGWAASIPCSAVNGEGLEYYVSAFNERDEVYAEAGHEDEPVHLSIVSARTSPAVALPGELPPDQCPDPNGPHRAGESCESTAQCASGLQCEHAVCAVPAGPDYGPRTYFSFDLGGGLGIAALGGTPGYDEARPVNPMDPMSPSECPPTVSCPATPSGAGLSPFLTLTVRGNITRRIAVAGAVRFQPDAIGRTTLSPLLLSLRAYAAVLPGGFVRRGPVLAPFIGTGVGQIQPRPMTPTAERPNARTGHIVSGLNNVNAGARFEYGFGPGLRAGAELTLQFMFGRAPFLFDADLGAFFGLQL